MCDNEAVVNDSPATCNDLSVMPAAESTANNSIHSPQHLTGAEVNQEPVQVTATGDDDVTPVVKDDDVIPVKKDDVTPVKEDDDVTPEKKEADDDESMSGGGMDVDSEAVINRADRDASCTEGQEMDTVARDRDVENKQDDGKVVDGEEPINEDVEACSDRQTIEPSSPAGQLLSFSAEHCN